MENPIKRAIMAINQTMCSPGVSNFEKDVLKDIRSSFAQLSELRDPTKDNWIELFSRQLNRLLNNNNNKPFSFDFWTELHRDILYMLGNKNDPEKTAFGGSFHKRMTMEKEIKQRELKFSENFQKQKNLQQFLNEHQQFFEIYLENCISFHSKLQVEKLFDDMTKFSEDFLGMKNGVNLQKKFNCINIEYDCSDRILYSFNFNHLKDNYSFRNIVEDINNYSLLKDSSNLLVKYSRMRLVDLLEKYRWIVILSDPGNSKTTILRWITYRFAQAAKNASKTVKFEDKNGSRVTLPVRIPILIRIGEFITWLEQDQRKTLIDYIGEHTWFSKCYCSDEKNRQIILKELVSQGHTLILLDGLDEISDTHQISNIIRCVENFIKEYVLSSDFISAFDEKICDTINETQLPAKSIGNQIIITSRSTNYRFNSIMGPFIQHSLLPLIDHEDAKRLVSKWTKQIVNSITNILDEEKLKYDRNKIEKQLEKRGATIKRIFREKFNFLRSNTSLLFLVAKLVLQSTEVTFFRRRVDIYCYRIEKELNSWSQFNQTIPQDAVTYFLTKLAVYLHLQSSSGLIDGFNIERLCCLVLKEHNVSRDRNELCKYTESIIHWLKSNIGFASENALNVYSFLHLSYQEYFVAMAFADVEHFRIETIVQRILSYAIYPRFRESLLLAMGLISSKLSQEKYDQFCEHLFTTTMNNYSVPFGVLLFVDSIRDLHKLPSEEFLFQALNELFRHSCYSFSKKYFISSLSKLFRTYTENWMQSCITEENSLEKILKLCLIEGDTYPNRYRLKVIYEKLRSFYDPNSSKEFFIDQILRRTFRIPFGLSFDENISSSATALSHTHPLIISIVSGLFGDMQYFLRKQSIDFESFILNIRVKSSVLNLICVHYFSTTDQPDSVKIESLIQELQKELDNSLPTEISLDIVEIFIALICLQGVSQPLIYEKYAHYKALSLALDKFKQTWFYFKQSIIFSKTHDSFESTFTSICSQTKSVMKNFSFHSDNIDVDCQSFTIACASAWKKIGLYNCTERHEKFNTRLQPNLIHLPSKEILYKIHEKAIFNENLLCFLPQSMQKLFSHIELPLVVFLSQCLIHLEDVTMENYYHFLAFPMLCKLFIDNKLENYALILFREKYANMDHLTGEQKHFYYEMKKKKLFKYFLNNETKDYEKLVTIERKRIKESRTDVDFFAASISLARIFQIQHRVRKDKLYDPINLDADKNQEIISSTKKISDPSLRIIALTIMLNMKDPLIVDEEQRNNLIQNEIIPLLNDSLIGCSLILLTFLFVQSHKIHQFFPESFQQTSRTIVGKLTATWSGRKRCPEQEAAYIALKQLNDPYLSHNLFKFEKRTKDLSNLLRFNSTIFHRYLSARNTFDLSDQNLLSSMYFVELAFDCQILRMYTNISQNNTLDLKQLWMESSKTEKIMTYRVAQWIDNNLPTLDQQEIQQIIDDVSQCLKIERKALTIIASWLKYRKNKNLKFFTHYAALQLIIHDSTEPNLADIIGEMLAAKRNLLKKRSFQENSFCSLLINSQHFGKVLFDLRTNSFFLSMISMTVNRQDLLKIILDLEFERITSQTSKSSRSFLLIIESISKDLQDYLIEHLQQQMIGTSTTKQAYTIVVIKRLTEISASYRIEQNYPEKLYDYILVDMFRNQQIPQTQKVILYGLYSAFFYNGMDRQKIVLFNRVQNFLEEILCSWITFEENIVDAALLIYGNYLLCFEEAQINEKVCQALENMHKHSSDRRFIRTSICLIIMKDSCRDYDFIITNLFDNHEYAYNNEQKYKILLQLTLYQFNKWTSVRKTNGNDDDENITSNAYHFNEDINTKEKVCDYLILHSDELRPIFIRDLYDFLCKNNDSSDLTSVNLIDIAVELIRKNLTEFLKAIRKSPYDEEKFRTQLECYYQQNANNRKISTLRLYTVFNVLTIEFLNMIEQFIDDGNYEDEYNQLSFEFEQVSDRNTVEKLFELILSNNTTDEKFRIYSNILSSVAHPDQISLTEIHQKIQLINNDSSDCDREEQMLNILLKCCGINNDHMLIETKIFTKNDIEHAYRSDMEDIDKNSNLFSQGNYHFKEIF
ncbi:unnamed protein product [Adineta ricciae]|uniref:NACHT domain-containing protein n=1 Tax=Adineta ricciae TaxID=249248 RepID=A0A815T7V4_ADIRI|nr:unnamed protein product [Adineta ricciae]